MGAYDLDPALAAYIAESSKFVSKTQRLSDRREMFAEACAYFTPQPPLGVVIQDHTVDGVAVRTYVPRSVTPLGGWPSLLYFHGGGWDLGSHKTHDWFAYALIRRIDVAIVAIDYRLAPEHPFPAPLEDGLKVWLALKNGELSYVDCARMGVAGDSAGGTLAAGLCIALKEQGEQQPSCQALVYPVLTDSKEMRSMQEHANAPMLSTAGLAVSLEGYVPNEKLKRDPRALALKNYDAAGLAPAFIGVAEFDPLFDHGLAYAALLKAAGIHTELHIGKRLVHASLRASGVPEVERFYDVLAEAINNFLTGVGR
ncbi:alpha/beta hydrolase [Pseudomonas syringae]|uniref:alpha/beta hydrolase n=1 Tax=Pseudomonas syringae TaxID=317 RepID=UPI000467DB9C|nr:alpha/beta hydrolase [Pseudomonas syringae]